MARFRRTVLATVTAAFTIVGTGGRSVTLHRFPTARRPTDGGS